MFFPEEEYPTEAVEQALEQLGVLCSVLPDLVPSYAIQNNSNSLNDTEGKRLAGFSMKSAALLLSSFEEVRAAAIELLAMPQGFAVLAFRVLRYLRCKSIYLLEGLVAVFPAPCLRGTRCQKRALILRLLGHKLVSCSAAVAS